MTLARSITPQIFSSTNGNYASMSIVGSSVLVPTENPVLLKRPELRQGDTWMISLWVSTLFCGEGKTGLDMQP